MQENHIPQRLNPNNLKYLLEEITLAAGCILQGLGNEQATKNLGNTEKLPLFAVYPREEPSAFNQGKKLLQKLANNPLPYIFEFIWLGLDIRPIEQSPEQHCRAIFTKEEHIKTLLQTKNKHVIFFNSIGKEYHENHYLEATIDLFTKVIQGCVVAAKETETAKGRWRILVVAADTLQAYNDPEFDSQREQVLAECREKGEAWIKQTKPVFEQLKQAAQGVIDIEIIFVNWDTLLSSAKGNYHFEYLYKYLQQLYSQPEISLEAKLFAQSIDKTGAKYLARQQKQKPGQKQGQRQEQKNIANSPENILPDDLKTHKRLVGLSDLNLANDSAHWTEQIFIVRSMLVNIKQLKKIDFSAFNPPVIDQAYCVRREVLTKELEQFFAFSHDINQATASIVIAACEGNGGVGKTYLAAYYADCASKLYTKCIWMRADTISVYQPTSLDKYFKLLAEALNLMDEKTSTEEIRKKVIEWLESHPGWLLILDNVEDYKIIKDYIPKKGGHVIITSRQKNPDINIKTIEVDMMSEEEAIELLEKISGRNTQRQEFATLAKKLGYLPLALELAGAYLKKYPEITLSEYLEKYDANCLELMSEKSLIISRVSNKSVAATFYASLHQIREEYKKTDKAKSIKRMFIIEEFLTVCAYLAPVNIPVSVLLHWLIERYLDDVKEDTKITFDILLQLAQHSLIKWEMERDIFSIHPVLQDILRAKYQNSDMASNDTAKLQWVTAIVRSIGIAINKAPSDNVINKYLIYHLQLVFQRYSNLPDPRIQSEFGYAIATAHIKLGTPREAIQSTERALQLQGNTFRDIVFLKIELAYAYTMNNEFEKSKDLLEELVIMVFSQPDREDDKTKTKNPNDRTKYILSIVENYPYLEKHPTVELGILTCLSAVYLQLKLVEESIRLNTKILAAEEIKFGTQSYKYLSSFIHRAKIYAAQKQRELQKAQVVRACEIFENIFKADNPENISILSQLSEEFFEIGDKEKAKKLLISARKILENNGAKIETDVKLATLVRKIAKLQFSMQEKFENIAELEAAVHTIEGLYGEIHAETIDALIDYGLALCMRRELYNSITVFEMACVRQEKYYGRRNIRVAQTMTDLADLYWAVSNYERMKQLSEEVLAILEATPDLDKAIILEEKQRLEFAVKMLNCQKAASVLTNEQCNGKEQTIDDKKQALHNCTVSFFTSRSFKPENIRRTQSHKLYKQCWYFKPTEKELIKEFSEQLKLKGFAIKIKPFNSEESVLKINLAKSHV